MSDWVEVLWLELLQVLMALPIATSIIIPKIREPLPDDFFLGAMESAECTGERIVAVLVEGPVVVTSEKCSDSATEVIPLFAVPVASAWFESAA